MPPTVPSRVSQGVLAEMSEHGLAWVSIEKQEVVCFCGNISKIGHLVHMRLHGVEPTPAAIEDMWKRAIAQRNALS